MLLSCSGELHYSWLEAVFTPEVHTFALKWVEVAASINGSARRDPVFVFTFNKSHEEEEEEEEEK